MKKKFKIGCIAVILGVIALITIPMLLRYRANAALGKELRKEVDAWLASLPKIPESENGAPVINKAVAQFEDFHGVFQDWNPRIDSEAAATTFSNYIAGKKEAFHLLEKGLAYEKWAYTTDYEKGYEATIPNLLNFKCMGITYCLKGELARLEGKDSDALQNYLTALRLAATLSEERNLISQMVYVSVATIGLKHIAAFVPRSNLSQLDLAATLKTLLMQQRQQVDITDALETEYFTIIVATAELIEGEKGFRYLFDMNSGEPGFLESIIMSKWIYDYSYDVELIRKWHNINQRVEPAKYYKQSDLKSDYHDLSEELRRLSASHSAIIAVIALPASLVSYKVVVGMGTMFRGAIVLVAIRLYEAKNGSLPESLDALGELVPKEILIDPFSGKNLIYRREGDDFYLYSTGYNGVDDNCKDSRSVFEKDVDPESVPDIVFHKPLN